MAPFSTVEVCGGGGVMHQDTGMGTCIQYYTGHQSNVSNSKFDFVSHLRFSLNWWHMQYKKNRCFLRWIVTVAVGWIWFQIGVLLMLVVCLNDIWFFFYFEIHHSRWLHQQWGNSDRSLPNLMTMNPGSINTSPYIKSFVEMIYEWHSQRKPAIWLRGCSQCDR